MELLPTEEQGELRNPFSGSLGMESVTSTLVEKGKIVYLDSSGTKDSVSTTIGEESIGLLGPIRLPITVGGFSGLVDWYVFKRMTDTSTSPQTSAITNSIMLYGDTASSKNPPIIRLHSACHTGDILGSMRCDCGPQLRESLRRILGYGSGVLVYISGHEGRGIGLWAKALAYILQDQGYDTYQANEILGYPQDARNYFDCLVVLRHLLGNSREVKLLSNNPQKKTELESQGFRVVELISLVAGVNSSNIGYLKAKMKHGHKISLTELG